MTLQQDVATYLRELADKVERSSYCTISSTDNRVYTVGYMGRCIAEKVPTGERQVELKLNYIEENT